MKKSIFFQEERNKKLLEEENKPPAGLKPLDRSVPLSQIDFFDGGIALRLNGKLFRSDVVFDRVIFLEEQDVLEKKGSTSFVLKRGKTEFDLEVQNDKVVLNKESETFSAEIFPKDLPENVFEKIKEPQAPLLFPEFQESLDSPRFSSLSQIVNDLALLIKENYNPKGRKVSHAFWHVWGKRISLPDLSGLKSLKEHGEIVFMVASFFPKNKRHLETLSKFSDKIHKLLK